MLRIFRQSLLLKTVTSFLLLTILTQVIYPAAAYALTAGPTAPEATSFEPIDTTDMVNLQSGDFTYNVPLLEVPGPEGGYPLALSYHAGIQPNEEASWVGLGFSLNPGAINRTVNGYADDHSGAQVFRQDYWAGGETHTWRVGATYGIPGTLASVSANLSVSHDTYLGVGVGWDVGVSTNLLRITTTLGLNLESSLNMSVGRDGYGHHTGGVGIDASISQNLSKNGNLKAAITASTNFETTNIGGSITKGSTSLGYSMNTTTGASSYSARSKGFSASIRNDKAGNISKEGFGFSIPIPTVVPGLWGNIGYEYERYWSNEFQTTATYGILKNPAQPSTLDSYKTGFDSYSLLQPEIGIAENPEADKVMGGTFPNIDDYQVMAQGLAGSMRPYLYRQSLYQQSYKDGQDNWQVEQYPLAVQNYGTNNVDFRFIGDFSNAFRVQPAEWNPSMQQLAYKEPSTGEFKNNRLAGSKHIEWFTNEQVNNKTAQQKGFIHTTTTGFTRPSALPSSMQIGGFMITNESGVTYHYALPAYAWGEYIKTFPKDQSGGERFSKIEKFTPYAYTWYLTAVTGPDFVDTNENGLVDDTDWGYWVNFEYGKWSSMYRWRNPSEGFHTDLNTDFQTYSKGEKELYYLDAIQTRTHTALFVKSPRKDGKGVVNLSNDEATFLPVLKQAFCGPVHAPVRYIDYYDWSSSVMRLDSVCLLKNEDLKSVLNGNLLSLKSKGDLFNHNFSVDQTCQYLYDGNEVGMPPEYREHHVQIPLNIHHADNVVDSYDFTDPTFAQAFRKACIRVTTFDYDYSLCPGTPNSISNDNLYSSTPQVDAQRYGKLTLKALNFKGKQGADITPPMNFEYDLLASERKEVQIYIQSYQATTKKGVIEVVGNQILDEGDILTFSWNGHVCHVVITNKIDHHNTYFFKDISIQTPTYVVSQNTIQAHTTKNPPYNKEAQDMWGLYKSDYETKTLANGKFNDNLARLTSKVSARSLDVWSLRRIVTPMGAVTSIDYEPDSYRKPVLYKNNLLSIASMTPQAANEVELTFYEQEQIGDLRTLFDGGSMTLNATYMLASKFFLGCAVYGCVNIYGTYYEPLSLTNAPITQVSATAIRIQSNDLYQRLTQIKQNITYNGQWGICHNLLGQQIPSQLQFSTKSFLTVGNASFEKFAVPTPGGGIRVKQIRLDNNEGLTAITSYDYQNSGVTSFEPMGIDKAIYSWNTDYGCNRGDGNGGEDRRIDEAQKAYSRELHKNFFDMLANAREVPPPGVMYEYVTIRTSTNQKNQTIQTPGHVTHQFEVFKPDMIELVQTAATNNLSVQPRQVGNHTIATGKSRTVSLVNHTGRIGAVRKTTTYDVRGLKLTETLNHFLHDQDATHSYENLMARYNYQGIVQESYGAARYVREKNGDMVLKVISSKREDYPSILTGTTTIDYKTGRKTSSENLAFDFYSGALVKSLTTDGYGNRFMSESVPAYHIYEAMGPKGKNATNKHMLTQNAASYVYQVDANNQKTGLLTASMQTWSDQVPVFDVTNGKQTGIWRSESSYVFIPTGTHISGVTPFTQFTPFSFVAAAVNANWRKTAEITLYDRYSKALEAKDVNGNYGATKMGYNQTRVVASGSLANYNEIAFCSAEDEEVNHVFGGGVAARVAGTDKTQVAAVSTYFHTGDKSLQVNAGQKGFIYTQSIGSQALKAGRNYIARVWVRNAHGVSNENDRFPPADARLYYTINGQTVPSPAATAQKHANGWYALTLNVPVGQNSTGTVEIGCVNNGSEVLYFDDFRFQPLDGGLTGYVYDTHTGELTYILDNNNLFTRYEYDAVGRLVRVYKETFQYGVSKISETKYNYARK